jgi:hypothetical protein
MIELSIFGSTQCALVDEGMEDLTKYRWRLDRGGYVYRKKRGNRIYLHHLVLPGSRWPMFVRDHANRNKLDNRSANLRWLDQRCSAQNKGPQKRNSTGIRGVTKYGKGYRAVVTLDGTVHRLGTFRTIEEATRLVSEWRLARMPFSFEG